MLLGISVFTAVRTNSRLYFGTSYGFCRLFQSSSLFCTEKRALLERPNPVSLDYETFEAPRPAGMRKANTDAVVLCHGLFGSKQNWRSIGKAVSQRLGVKVYALDLRNHGTSPHVDSMSYLGMASDLEKFFKDHCIINATLVGHSMGGKAVQAFALSSSMSKSTLSHLVSVDMSPARGPLSIEFAQYIKAMIEIEDANCQSRNEADQILKKYEKDFGIRQFLLTNLIRPTGAKNWTFRIPIKIIRAHLDEIGDFPYDSETSGGCRPIRSWSGSTLFVKGKKSKYINHKNRPLCDSFFPNARHIELETGHWVQAEDPQTFIEELCHFVAGANSGPQ